MSSFTISAWVYPRSSNGAIISKVTPNRDFVFQIYNGKLNFHITTNFDQYCHAYGGTTIPLNTWTKVAVTVEPGKITLYVNGIVDGERTSNVTLPQWTGTDMAIGRMSSCSYFNGLLDDIQIYEGILSASALSEGVLSQSVSSDVYAKGMWKFDGNALDSSGNNAHGTAVNATYAPGKNGQALNLSGSNSYVNISNSGVFNKMGSFTISAWVYPRSSNGAIISKVTPNRDFVFQIYNGKLNFHITTNFNQYCHAYGGTTIPLNTWTHIAVTVEAGKITLYVNGVKDGERTSNVTLPQWTGTDMAIGRMSSCSYYNGLLDDIRIYEGAQTGAGIVSIINNN